MSRYVLDSFAILAWYQREDGGLHVQQLLNRREHQRWMTIVNFGEVYYAIAKNYGLPTAPEALAIVDHLPITLVDVDRMLALAAADLKARYPVAYAGCFAAALARQLNAAVVTGDREFARLERDGVVDVEWIPSPRR